MAGKEMVRKMTDVEEVKEKVLDVLQMHVEESRHQPGNVHRIRLNTSVFQLLILLFS